MNFNLVFERFIRVTIVALLFLLSHNLYANTKNIRALWVVRDDMVSKELIDKFISFSIKYNYKHIFVQIRGRGDAYYKSNLVPRSHLLMKNNFDPLEYLISKTKDLNLKVHAWFNVYYLWSSPNKPSPLDKP